MLRRTPLSALAALSTVALALVACGDDELAPSGTGGGTATSTTTPAATTSTGGDGGSGAGDATGGGGEGGQDACPLLEPGDPYLTQGSFARWAIEGTVEPPLDDVAKTRLTLELYEDDGSGELPPVEEGTFDLSQPPDDNYGTCQHCVLLVGYAPNGQPVRAFSAVEGTMSITALGNDPFMPILAGSIEGIRLVEVTQNEDFTWEEIPGGPCFRVAEWTFDTTPTPGAACHSQESCGNEAVEVCSPESATCVAPECSLTFDPPYCDEGDYCLAQIGAIDGSDGGSASGACYTGCDPAGDDCASGEACVPLGPTQAIGICLATGGPAVGEPCEPTDVATGCAEGALCRGEPSVCAQICDYLTETSGCPEDTVCAIDNVCRPANDGDPAAIGEACDPLAKFTMDCGAEGDAFRGICMNFFPEDVGTTCERLCRLDDPACPGTEECLGLFSNPFIGICREPAVCGDGELDVIGGEVCDDGDDEGGDGCSADCREAELGPLCASAPELVLGEPIQGTNVGGATGYTASCDPYIATPTARYTFTPPAAGKLTLHLESTADLGLQVLGDCDDLSTELGCAGSFGVEETLEVNFLATSDEPALILVRGANPSEASAFTLTAEFAVAVCGDGDVGGPEACDDGGTESGDGCSGDCLTIEWEQVCAALPELELGANEGDTTGAADLFDLSGECSFVGGGGPERAYAFTAPADGLLSLALDEQTADFTLYVQDGCGPAAPETYLACSNFADVGQPESIEVLLTAGQRVTVVVDGFTSDREGPYTLTAAFTAE